MAAIKTVRLFYLQTFESEMLRTFCMALFALGLSASALGGSVNIVRLGTGPIIHAGLDPSIGENIQGPSLVRVPDWVQNPLGKYYLYFADHKGGYIRLAYADDLLGPWQIHVPGSLQLGDTPFLRSPPKVSAEERVRVEENFKARGVKISHDIIAEVTAPHIASPDVHVDEANQRFVMYYHGLEGVGQQVTRVAISEDGVHFSSMQEVLGQTYWRSFVWKNHHYALAMPGQFYRSKHPFTGYEKGPKLFNPNMRHNAVLIREGVLYVFWTQVGDVPEHIKLSTIELSGDWMSWKEVGGNEVLRPEFAWEGSQAPLEPSVRSTAYGVLNQLRDPAIFVDEGMVYLLYAIGGEAGVALARVEF